MSESLQRGDSSSNLEYYISGRHHRRSRLETVQEQTSRSEQGTRTTVQLEEFTSPSRPGQRILYERPVDSSSSNSSSSSSSSSDSFEPEIRQSRIARRIDEVNRGSGYPSLGMRAARAHETPVHTNREYRPNDPRMNPETYTVSRGVDNIRWSSSEAAQPNTQSANSEEDSSSQAQPLAEDRGIRFSFYAGRDDVLTLAPFMPMPTDETLVAESGGVTATPSMGDGSM